MSSKLELIRKLKALAERGEGGERINAEKLLAQVMLKYNLTDKDVEDDVTEHHLLSCTKEQQKIMVQVVLKVMGKDVEIYGHKHKKYAKIIRCSMSQYLEIETLFKFYWTIYKKELDRFQKAFIYKNNLLPSDGGSVDLDKLTPEQREELKKTISLMGVMEQHELRKQLNS